MRQSGDLDLETNSLSRLRIPRVRQIHPIRHASRIRAAEGWPVALLVSERSAQESEQEDEVFHGVFFPLARATLALLRSQCRRSLGLCLLGAARDFLGRRQ